MSGLTAEIVLTDRDPPRAEGHVHDLRDAEVFSHNTRIFAMARGEEAKWGQAPRPSGSGLSAGGASEAKPDHPRKLMRRRLN